MNLSSALNTGDTVPVLMVANVRFGADLLCVAMNRQADAIVARENVLVCTAVSTPGSRGAGKISGAGALRDLQ